VTLLTSSDKYLDLRKVEDFDFAKSAGWDHLLRGMLDEIGQAAAKNRRFDQ
jgi:hypothetical protein